MIQRIEKYCKRNGMIDKGDRIVIGLSGGADSVCLFFVLMGLQEKYDLTLQAVHIHHGIRGDEADRDAAFVEELCRQYQIPCLVEYYDVLLLAKQQGWSVEEAGRRIRYQVMERVRKEMGFTKIAVAHHSGDQAETILFHLCRGSGLAGLRGMQPLSGAVIRPLLLVRRQEIEAFLRERKQDWCMDSTNLENNYSRNLLRNQVLPLLTEQMNSDTVGHIAAAGEILGEAYDYIQKEAQRWADVCIVKRGTKERELMAEKLVLLAPLIRREIYRLVLEEMGGLRDITAVHLEQVEDLLLGTVGRSVDLPAYRKVERTYHSLLFSEGKLRGEFGTEAGREKGVELKKEARAGLEAEVGREFGTEAGREKGVELKREARAELEAEVGGEAGGIWGEQKDKKQVEWGDETILVFGETYWIPSGDVISIGVPEDIEQFCQKNGIKREKILEENPCTKCFDYDTIKGTLKLRTREVGDYLELGAGLGRKTLKKYFIDQKIPKEERDQIPLIAEGNHILWVIGYRISAGYKVTEATRTILQIKISGGQ